MASRVMLILLGGVLTGNVLAGDPQDLKILDMNQDSFLGPDEARGLDALTGQWERLDRNRDGVLDAEEFAGFEYPAPKDPPQGVQAKPTDAH